MSDRQTSFKKCPVPKQFSTGPTTFFKSKEQCICYFHTQGFSMQFHLKANSPGEKKVCFESHCVIAGSSGDKGPFGTNSRLHTKETAGWVWRNPWDPFSCRGSWSITNHVSSASLTGLHAPPPVFLIAKISRSTFIQQYRASVV